MDGLLHQDKDFFDTNHLSTEDAINSFFLESISHDYKIILAYLETKKTPWMSKKLSREKPEVSQHTDDENFYEKERENLEQTEQFQAYEKGS